jgi:thiol-disulfide isomerase/thioredoxin
MMRCKKILFLLAIIQQLCFSLQAQEIKIGEKVPDTFLPQILRYKKNKINLLSEFKGKALIIDFWFTHCTICIASMPKLDSLQKKFKEDLNVLMSTYEPKEIISNFLNKKKILAHVTLPTTTSDTILTKLFPHMSAPHEIWIDKNGIVQAITSHVEVTEANIRRLINGEKLNLPVKIEANDLFGSTKPFLNANPITTYLCSYIGGFQKGMPCQSYITENNGLVELKISNLPLKSLYLKAYEQDKLKPSQYIYQNVDTSIFESSRYGENFFCYNLIMKDSLSGKMGQYMRQDLDRYFNMSSRLITQKTICYTISKINNIKSTPDALKPDDFSDSYKEGDQYVFKNVYWQGVLNYLNTTLEEPLIDETGNDLRTPIKDLILPSDWKNLEEINKKISTYNLILKKEYRNMNVLVFSNTNKNDITKK